MLESYFVQYKTHVLSSEAFEKDSLHRLMQDEDPELDGRNESLSRCDLRRMLKGMKECGLLGNMKFMDV